MSEIITVPMAAQRDIQTITAEIRVYVHQGMVAAIEIGRRLVEAKDMLEHGEWGRWLEEEANISQSNAQIYMSVFREYGSGQQSLYGDSSAMLEKIPNLTMAHELLAIKDLAEREKFVEEHDLSEMSTRELKQAIRERDEAKDRAEEAERALDQARSEATGYFHSQQDMEKKWRAAQDEARSARERAEKEKANAVAAEKKLKELQEHPEIPEGTMEQLRREAEEKAAKEALEKVQKKLEKEKKRAAEAEKAERQAKEKLENIRKQSAMADADTALFSLHYKEIQNKFEQLKQLYARIREQDEEKADKLKGAMKALLESMEETWER
ncbi:MAG: DUF3102 domain-containing protein [Clostridiales bacterium]|nr:DUF3102 domain-containing protein [Candidatus Cacconaster stercorequi]